MTVNPQVPPSDIHLKTCGVHNVPVQVFQLKQLTLESSHPSLTAAMILILQFVVHIPCVHAVNLGACCTKLRGIQGPPPQPPPNTTGPPPLPPLNVSYIQCLEECGTGIGDVDWQDFSQNFGAWFLPWISLMFQIPFGAERKPQPHTSTLRLTKACFCQQNHWMTSSPSSSPWVHPPLPRTLSKSHT